MHLMSILLLMVKWMTHMICIVICTASFYPDKYAKHQYILLASMILFPHHDLTRNVMHPKHAHQRVWQVTDCPIYTSKKLLFLLHCHPLLISSHSPCLPFIPFSSFYLSLPLRFPLISCHFSCTFFGHVIQCSPYPIIDLLYFSSWTNSSSFSLNVLHPTQGLLNKKLGA